MTFVPGLILITGVTQNNPGVVTTATNHNLTTGQVVRIHIPPAYGMKELDNTQAEVTVLSLTTFSIQSSQVPFTQNIDTTNFQAFTNAAIGTPAHFVCVGSASTPLLNTSAQVIKGEAFDPLDDATVNNSTTEIPF